MKFTFTKFFTHSFQAISLLSSCLVLTSANANQISSVDESQSIQVLAENLDTLLEASGGFEITSGKNSVGTDSVCKGTEATESSKSAASKFKNIVKEIYSRTEETNKQLSNRAINNALKDVYTLLEGNSVKVCVVETSDSYYFTTHTVFLNLKTNYIFTVSELSEN